MSPIKDKELLTFSNLTNLDWQFVELTSQSTQRESNNSEGETQENVSNKLTELLKPDSFVRKYDDGKEEDVYPKGISEMREKAPVAMNYLEECGKNSGEGDFLQEWEAWVS